MFGTSIPAVNNHTNWDSNPTIFPKLGVQTWAISLDVFSTSRCYKQEMKMQLCQCVQDQSVFSVQYQCIHVH